MALHNDTGRMGEAFAVARLEEKGYTILCKNFATFYGELDIVAALGEILAFVEVRTKKAGSGSPVETVTKAKRKRLIAAAYIYLERHPSDLQPRFDIVSVTSDKAGTTVEGWEHFEGAFDGSDYDGNF